MIVYLPLFIVLLGAVPLLVLLRSEWNERPMPEGLVRTLFALFVVGLGGAWWLGAAGGEAPPLFALVFPLLQLGLFRAFQESFRSFFGRAWEPRASASKRFWDGAFHGLFLLAAVLGPGAATIPYFDSVLPNSPRSVELPPVEEP